MRAQLGVLAVAALSASPLQVPVQGPYPGTIPEAATSLYFLTDRPVNGDRSGLLDGTRAQVHAPDHLAAAVPEPPTAMAGLGVGLILLVFVLRKKLRRR